MQKTPLNVAHRDLDAVLVDFHGWEMPVRYGAIPDEHAQVRSQAGLFDLCHMGRLESGGPDADAWLPPVVAGNLDMQRHYRTDANVIGRPVRRGIAVIGHHEINLPLLRVAILCALSDPPTAEDPA